MPRVFYTVALFVILFVSLIQSRTLPNTAMSIDSPLQSRQDNSQVINFNEDFSNSENNPRVMMESSIIVVPRRNSIRCEPNERLDRRGKCRMVW